MTECTGVIGVVGSGTMGAGIALVALQAGCQVVLYDVQEEALQRARIDIEKRTDRLVTKGVITASERSECLARLVLSSDLQQMSDAVVVIEAAPERMELKKTIFAALDEVCPTDAILASNTSSLSVSVIAAATKYPARVIGMHFFNPAPVMKLVEVVLGEDTSDAAKETIESLARQMGKEPIVCKDTPGFIVNRVARNYYGEALRIVGEGTAPASTVDELMQSGAGFRMGPFALMDLIGIDVNFDVTQSVYHAYHEEPRYRPHLLQAQKVAMGQLGRKTGRGYYRYDEDTTAANDTDAHHVQPECADGTIGKVVVVGDTPLAGDLRRRLSERLSIPEDECGLVYRGPIACWDTVGTRWRSEEIEAWLRQRGADAVLISFAGESGYHRELLQAVERGAGKRAWLLSSLAGPSATEQASWLAQAERLIGMNMILPLVATDRDDMQSMEWARPMQAEPTGEAVVGAVHAVAKQLHLRPIEVRDGAGGVMLRVLAMIFNEAAEVVREGVASALDIDTGMQLGTNYPAGPAQWMDQIGLPSVWFTLEALYKEHGDDRYRPSPLLRKMLLSGRHGERVGHGWYRYSGNQQNA